MSVDHLLTCFLKRNRYCHFFLRDHLPVSFPPSTWRRMERKWRVLIPRPDYTSSHETVKWCTSPCLRDLLASKSAKLPRFIRVAFSKQLHTLYEAVEVTPEFRENPLPSLWSLKLTGLWTCRKEPLWRTFNVIQCTFHRRCGLCNRDGNQE